MIYRKHRPIRRTFLLNIFVSNRGCGLSARTSVHHAVNLHKLTVNRFNVAFLEQANVTQQGISIPPQSCLQCRWWMLASTEIDPPRARKYHVILEYSRGKWPTISWLFNSMRQICWIDYRTLFEELMSENKCIFALRTRCCVLNCT